MKKYLLFSAAIGAMTAAERSKGRYMRAPDGHGDDDGGFGEFEKAGEIEIGQGEPETPEPEEKPAKPKAKAPAAKPAAKPAEPVEEGEDDAGEDDQGEAEEGEEEQKPPKKTQTPSERIRELNKRLRQSERLRLADADRISALENGRLPAPNSGGNSGGDIGASPDPLDQTKYPLGHLDDRYIEDKLEWLATKKAAAQADAVLQRQQENDQRQTQQQQQTALLEKVDDLVTRGSEHFDDFQEAVLDAGMRGEWRLDQPTFEAAHEAENGAQILYELSQDKTEAARVAKLSPYAQLKFVADRDAEISKTKQPRKIPRAGEPPSQTPRGANSSRRISPSTDNLDDFEKAWESDAKGKR